MKRNIFIGFGAILVIPICINFLLQCSTPNACNIVGTSIDWLNFMGAYIGGIVTALVSFYILFTTIQHNKKEAEINRMNDQLNRLREDLAERMGDFNFCQIMNIIPKLTNNPNINDEINYLNNLYDTYIQKKYIAEFLYQDSTDNTLAKEFFNAYGNYIDESCRKIDEITRLINNIKGYETKLEQNYKENGITKEDYKIQKDLLESEFKKGLFNISEEINKLIDHFHQCLSKTAITYYNAEKEKLNRLKGNIIN